MITKSKKEKLISRNTDSLMSELITNGLDRLEGVENSNPFFFDLSVISNIPKINLPELSDDEQDAILTLSKEVLLESKKNNRYKEVSITYRMDKKPEEAGAFVVAKGDSKSVKFLEDNATREMIENSGKNVIINFHNHPDGATFSIKDLFIFSFFQQIKMMEIINHKGQVSVLCKPDTLGHNLTHIIEQEIKNICPDIRSRYEQLKEENEDAEIMDVLTSKEKIAIVDNCIHEFESLGIIYLDYKGCDDLEGGVIYGQ